MAQTVDETARNRYFDVYTERASPDLGLQGSHSLSKLNIVPKQSRKSGSKRTRVRDTAVSGKLFKLDDLDIAGDSGDAAAVATIGQTSNSTSSIGDAGAGHLMSEEADSSEPVGASQQPLRPPRKSSLRSSGTSRQTANSERLQQVNTRLAVLPPDLYAGPTSPVSADSLTKQSLSRSAGKSHLAYLAEQNAASPAGNNKTAILSWLEEGEANGLGQSSSMPSSLSDENSKSRSLPRSSTTPSTTRRKGSRARSRTESAESATSLPYCSPTEEAQPFCSLDTTLITSPDTGIQSISEIISKHKSGPILTSLSMPASPPVPAIPDRFKAEPSSSIPSIDDIIRKNSATLGIPLRSAGRASSTPAPTTLKQRLRTATEGTDTTGARSSIDSIAGEVLQSLKVEAPHPKRALQHARSQPNLPVPLLPTRPRQSSGTSSSYQSRSESASSRPPLSPLPSMAINGESDEQIARYLRSTRLTRLLTLRKPPNHHLTVSLADVGSPYGHPVVVYLGLGSVRYLVALYDELATSLGLRLICIDRWGLGKTGDVPDSRRGFLEWSTVVEEVLDQLEIESFSILAHSAGAPYALASSIRLDERVKGSIHLLAPWVSTAAESAAGSYKWLRYVPSSVIKTAQAAEWKVQAWKLGKPPTVAVQGVGFNPRAPLSSESTASSPVFASFAKDYLDDESDPATPRPPITFSRVSASSSIASSLDQELAIRPSASTPSLLPVPARKPSLRTKKGSKGLFSSIFGSPKLDDSNSSAISSGSTLPARTSPPLKRSTSASPDSVSRSKDVKMDLGTALLRASHAESLRGGTADLLTILERTNKAAGFAYSDVERPVKVWHGLKDEKISLEGVLSLERTMQNCKVTVIPGADHSLMLNVPVIVQVLQSIASDWQHI